MPPPTTAINTLNKVSVTIGTSSFASDFAGLVPGYPGVYQIKGTVPTGVPMGDNIPVTITSAGQTSPAVKISVH
jgi:uncharacterized protein (TIGR03437 family)